MIHCAPPPPIMAMMNYQMEESDVFSSMTPENCFEFYQNTRDNMTQIEDKLLCSHVQNIFSMSDFIMKQVCIQKGKIKNQEEKN